MVPFELLIKRISMYQRVSVQHIEQLFQTGVRSHSLWKSVPWLNRPRLPNCYKLAHSCTPSYFWHQWLDPDDLWLRWYWQSSSPYCKDKGYSFLTFQKISDSMGVELMRIKHQQGPSSKTNHYRYLYEAGGDPSSISFFRACCHLRFLLPRS